MLVLGVDIGAKGTIAILDGNSGELVDVFDMPILADGPNGRPTVNAPLLAEIVLQTGDSERWRPPKTR